VGIAVIHYHVYDKNGAIVATSVTNLEIHDIARTCMTFGIGLCYIVTPLARQREIAGKLVVSGALDIGEKVEIAQGFEATGEIAVRNPMPVLVFILIYLMTMLRIENEKELDRILDNLFTEDDGKVEVPLMIPARSKLNMKVFSVPSSMKIGKKCRLHGNIRAGSIDVLEDTVIFGSLRARSTIRVAGGVTVHGNVEAARAGEYGRGFSVVAGDIRSLANESSENADRIKDLVKNVQTQITKVAGDIELAASKGRAELERTKASTANLDRIAQESEVVVADIREIARASGEAAAGLEQAGKASQQIATAAEETSRASTEAAGASEQALKAAQEIAQAIEDIASQADELQNG